MYIEFQLPRGPGGAPMLWEIQKEIETWAMKYGIPHTQKTIKYTLRLGFNDEKHFSIFSMTWTSKIPFQIVNIVNERY